MVQRIARRASGQPGSYNTGRLGMRFEGPGLDKTEEDGWIFASNGTPFAGVKFLDGGLLRDARCPDPGLISP